jgi:Fic family protein
MDQYSQTVKLWQSYRISTTAELDQHLDSFRILFAFHSGKIENDEITYCDTREIFENGKVINYSGSPRALLEQQNQKLCYEFLKEKIIIKEPLSIELIREIHKILTSGTYDKRRYINNKERPGEFKHDYVAGHEIGSAAEDVEHELAELIAEINAYDGGKALKAAAYFHAKFEYIHPFADGNGRVGQTCLNYFLMIKDHPPLIIYDDDKLMYYECLEKYDEAEELNSLYQFLKYETEKTWTEKMALAEGKKSESKGIRQQIYRR